MSISPSDPDRLDARRIEALMAVRFPQIVAGGRYAIEEVGPSGTRVRLKANPRNNRPGGTISGPAIFALADFSIYVAIIGALGEPGFEAVTASLTINFLARPEPGDLTAHVELIRLGRRLAVAEVEVYAQGVPDMVAHAIANYSLPSEAVT